MLNINKEITQNTINKIKIKCQKKRLHNVNVLRRQGELIFSCNITSGTTPEREEIAILHTEIIIPDKNSRQPKKVRFDIFHDSDTGYTNYASIFVTSMPLTDANDVLSTLHDALSKINDYYFAQARIELIFSNIIECLFSPID